MIDAFLLVALLFASLIYFVSASAARCPVFTKWDT
jgi:hypothetical protein